MRSLVSITPRERLSKCLLKLNVLNNSPVIPVMLLAMISKIRWKNKPINIDKRNATI